MSRNGSLGLPELHRDGDQIRILGLLAVLIHDSATHPGGVVVFYH